MCFLNSFSLVTCRSLPSRPIVADFDLKVAFLLLAAKVECKGCVLNGTTDRSSLLGEKEGVRGGQFGTGGAVRGVLAVTGEAIPLGVCPQTHGKCLSVLHSLSHVVSTDVS